MCIVRIYDIVSSLFVSKTARPQRNPNLTIKMRFHLRELSLRCAKRCVANRAAQRSGDLPSLAAQRNASRNASQRIAQRVWKRTTFDRHRRGWLGDELKLPDEAALPYWHSDIIITVAHAASRYCFWRRLSESVVLSVCTHKISKTCHQKLM